MNLGAIKERLAKAAPRPWEWRPGLSDDYEILVGSDGTRIMSDGSASGEYTPEIESTDPNGQFIVNAPTDIATLIGEVERLRTALAWFTDRANYLTHAESIGLTVFSPSKPVNFARNALGYPDYDPSNEDFPIADPTGG